MIIVEPHIYPPPSLFPQDNNGIERLVGDCTSRKKYSHIDLLHMINGVETEKATIAAGNRCYYLKVYLVAGVIIVSND